MQQPAEKVRRQVVTSFFVVRLIGGSLLPSCRNYEGLLPAAELPQLLVGCYPGPYPDHWRLASRHPGPYPGHGPRDSSSQSPVFQNKGVLGLKKKAVRLVLLMAATRA